MRSLISVLVLVLCLFGWLSGLIWLITGNSLFDYPLITYPILSLLAVSALAVVFGSCWWVRQEFSHHMVEHYTNDKYSKVSHILHHQASLLKISRPVLHVYESHQLNAFVVGGIWQRQHLYISEALIRELNQDELEAVVAHELAHIYHGDIVMNEIFYGICAAVIYLLQHSLGSLLALLVNRAERPELAKQVAIVVTYGCLLLPVWLMMLLYSRRSEYRADATASQLVGSQQFLWLLHRLKGVYQDNYFSLDRQAGFLRHYFTSHPPLHHRITALEAGQQT